jgi:hypothetical protein
MSYVELDPEAVVGAARNTAGTAADWRAWAARSQLLLGDVASGARDSTVGPAFQE